MIVVTLYLRLPTGHPQTAMLQLSWRILHISEALILHSMSKVTANTVVSGKDAPHSH